MQCRICNRHITDDVCNHLLEAPPSNHPGVCDGCTHAPAFCEDIPEPRHSRVQRAEDVT